MNEHENGFLLCFFLTQFRWDMNDKTSAKVIVLSLFTFPRLSVICMCNWYRLGQGWRGWLAPRFPGREWNISCLSWYVPIFSSVLYSFPLTWRTHPSSLFTSCFFPSGILPTLLIVAAEYSLSATVDMIPAWLYWRWLIIREPQVASKVNSASLGPHLWQ